MPLTVFYSWQSDLPNNTNRGFIENALEKAVKAISKDESLNVEPVIDRDTRNVPGSPDIFSAIKGKIDNAKAFVCDVSVINGGKEGERPTPNPNVLIELGYALKSLGDERVLMVANIAYGEIEALPFDINKRRVITYELDENTLKLDKKNDLAQRLERELRLIFSIKPKSSLTDEQLEFLCQIYKKSNGTLWSITPENLIDLNSELVIDQDTSLQICTALQTQGFIEFSMTNPRCSLTISGLLLAEKAIAMSCFPAITEEEVNKVKARQEQRKQILHFIYEQVKDNLHMRIPEKIIIDTFKLNEDEYYVLKNHLCVRGFIKIVKEKTIGITDKGLIEVKSK